MELTRIGTTARYSDIVIHNGTAWIVEVPTTESNDIGAQTREVLASLEKQLATAGSDKSRIVSATIYLTDMQDYAGMNAVWDAWLPAGTAPSRACIGVAKLAQPWWRVEIALVAAT